MVLHSKLQEAYVSLGLQEGCTLEAVKTSYKQAALRTHPDKNPDNPEATAEFQRVGEAYRLLEKHLGQPQRDSYDSHDDYGFYDSDEDFYDDFDDDDDGFPLPPMFFFTLFERMFQTRHGFSNQRNHHRPTAPPFRPYKAEEIETPQQYKERLERIREEQIAAQERREQEAKARKARREREREEEKQAAERRQKQKMEEKKSKAESQRKKAEEAFRLQSQRSQKLRSRVFQAARKGDVAKVKEDIWEHSVDATGGEVKVGCEEFVQSRPKDPKETLLHIAAKNDNLDLIEWLESHGADMEEKNSQGFTVLHTALKLGRISIIKYILEAYPPEHSEETYEAPEGSTLLSLAVESNEPELVWILLENKLASPEDITEAWAKATTGKMSHQGADKHSDIVQLLKTYGGLTPPATPQTLNDPLHAKFTAKSAEEKEGRKQQPIREPVSESPQPSGVTSKPQTSGGQRKSSRGRGRGRGKGRGRGSANSAPHR